MKEDFKQELRELNQLAKEDKISTANWSHDVGNDIKKKLDKDVAIDMPVKLLNKERIYKLQIQKRRIFLGLKTELRNLDNPKYRPERLPNQREVIMENEKFFCFDMGGEKFEITLGEILTDGEWGIEYYLDPETVPKNIRKKYLVEKYKSYMEDLLSYQFVRRYSEGGKGTGGDKVSNYKMLWSSNLKSSYGFAAEVMIENIFKKYFYDNGLDIEIIAANPEQDASKIDFIIKYRKHTRGVEVNVDDEYKQLGVQLTISSHSETLKNKLRKIEEVKEGGVLEQEQLIDLVLVTCPVEVINKSFGKWRSGKKSGGPDKLLTESERELIFRGVLKNIFTEEELNDSWKKIAESKLK